MKKLSLLFIIIIAALTTNAQNATVDRNGNYTAIKKVEQPAKSTGKTFTDAKGIVYPVYKSKNGKKYYIRKSKAGNDYKVYLKVN